MSRISSFIIAGVILLVSVALAALLISLAPEPTRTELPPQLPFAQTGLVTAGTGPIPIYGAGTVRPSAEIGIAPQVGGKIVWVAPGFQSGGRVQMGQMLFRIEEADFLYRVQEAEANLAVQRVALLEEEEKAEIAQAQYALYAASQGDSASTAAAGPLALREPQLNAARAALSRDEARLADANLALSRTKVTAPFAGFVREESVDVGQIVAAGQTVGRLFAADAVEVVVPLSDADAALIPGLWDLKAGDRVQRVAARVVTQYGDATHAYEGYVDRSEASVDEQTRTIDVIVRVPNPFPTDATESRDRTPPLLIGTFVEVELGGLAPASYFRLPRSALQPGNEIWTVNEEGIVHIVPVRVLQRANDEVFAIGSLDAGQRVITGGIQFATEGMRVLTEAAPTP